jgi:hypothetical protein
MQDRDREMLETLRGVVGELLQMEIERVRPAVGRGPMADAERYRRLEGLLTRIRTAEGPERL